jgi:group I intron endonuclease
MSDNNLLNKDEFHKVVGEIYKIINNTNGKCYVGQTRSHRLNHGKYRPFGSFGRFKDHISEARCCNKTGSKYLNSAIMKYGAESFTFEIITTCRLEELDDYERKYISDLNAKFPHGYNLTDGGQGLGYLKGDKINLDIEPIEKQVRVNIYKHSEETKKKIANGIKQTLNTEENKKSLMQRAQTQHSDNKFELLKDVHINLENPETHIHIRKQHKENYDFVVLKFKDRKISFVGKHEPLEETLTRAKNFMKELIMRRHVQIAGTTLEL